MLGFDPAAHALRVMWSASVGDYITALDVDSTGELLALGTDSGEVCVFDVTSSALRTRVTVHDGGVLSAKWSPTQRLLATSGQDGSLRLQDSDGNERCRQPSSRWIERLAWSPDGTRLAAASGSVVRIFDAEGRAMLATETHPGTVTGLAWNRRGNQFASACLDGVRIFHGDSPTRSRGLRWRVPLVSLSWSPNDAIIAAVTEANTVHFWRLPSGRDAEIAGFPARPRALAWDPASHFLATSGDAKVAVWRFDEDGPEGQRPLLFAGHQALCTVVAFHPKRRWLASGADDTRVMLWGVNDGDSPLAVGFLEETATGLSFALGGRALIGVDARGTVRVWDTE